MPHSPTQHALREMRQVFSNPVARMTLCAVVLLLGISGPFGTLEAISFGPRLAYWAVTVPLTFAVGVFISAVTVERLRARTSPWPTRIAAPCSRPLLLVLQSA